MYIGSDHGQIVQRSGTCTHRYVVCHTTYAYMHIPDVPKAAPNYAYCISKAIRMIISNYQRLQVTVDLFLILPIYNSISFRKLPTH